MKKLPIKEIIKAFEEGSTFVELGKKYGVSYQTIKRRLKKEIGESVQAHRNNSATSQEIVYDYQLGMSVRDISEKYGMSEAGIYYRIKTVVKKDLKKREVDYWKLYLEYLKGTSLTEITDTYNINHRTVVRNFKNNNYPYPIKRKNRIEVNKLLVKNMAK